MRAPTPGRTAAVVLGMLALVFGGASWKLGYWVQDSPGPGLLPLGASLLLALAAGVLLMANPSIDEDPEFSPTAFRAFALITVYGIGLAWGGVVLPSFVFATLWMTWLHRRRLVVALAASALIVGGGTLLFKVALGVPIPLWPDLP